MPRLRHHLLVPKWRRLPARRTPTSAVPAAELVAVLETCRIISGPIFPILQLTHFPAKRPHVDPSEPVIGYAFRGASPGAAIFVEDGFHAERAAIASNA